MSNSTSDFKALSEKHFKLVLAMEQEVKEPIPKELIKVVFDNFLKISDDFLSEDFIIPVRKEAFFISKRLGQSIAVRYSYGIDFSSSLNCFLSRFTSSFFEVLKGNEFSSLDLSCLKLFCLQYCNSILHGYLNELYTKLRTQRNIQELDDFSGELTPQYVNSIIRKLNLIPMIEISFDGKILHMNDSMKGIQKKIGKVLGLPDLLPEELLGQIDNLPYGSSRSKSIFREIKINTVIFQQFILILPRTRIFIVFFIEAHHLITHRLSNDILQPGFRYQQSELKKVKDTFLANMSHELRTPLNEIIGFADLLSEQFDGNLNEAQIEYVQMIQKGGERLLEFINHLLKMGEKEDSNSLQCIDTSFTDFLNDVINSIQSDCDQKSLTINVLQNNEAQTFKGDREKLHLALSEIISYIIKYLPHKSSINLTYLTDDNSFSFLISLPQSKDIVFADELVLSHASFFIDLMQGKLLMDTNENDEKTFIIKIPLSKNSKKINKGE